MYLTRKQEFEKMELEQKRAVLRAARRAEMEERTFKTRWFTNGIY
jgi:hypothetical protein